MTAYSVTSAGLHSAGLQPYSRDEISGIDALLAVIRDIRLILSDTPGPGSGALSRGYETRIPHPEYL